MGDAGAGVLAQAPQLGNLKGLSLSNTQIADEGLLALLNSPFLGSLTELHLRDNLVSDQALVALATASAARLPGLEWLNFDVNPIHAPDMAAIATILQNNPKLRIQFGGRPFPHRVARRLRRRFPRRVTIAD
jgi:hypothetical protein